MAVPVKDDEGLVGEVTRGFINFEGRTLDDALQAIVAAFNQIKNTHTIGNCYLAGETGYYSFEVEEGGTG